MYTAKDVIKLIVENNPGEVILRMQNYFRMNVSRWTQTQIIDYLVRLYNQGYDVSEFLEPVKVLQTSANFRNVQNFIADNSTPGSENAARLTEATEPDPNTNKSFWDTTFGKIMAGLGAGLAAGSILGNLLFPGQTKPGGGIKPPTGSGTADNRTFWQKVKDFYKNHAFIAYSLTAIGLFLLSWAAWAIFRKKKSAA